MEDGHKITFSGEGDQEPGLEPGDIVIDLDEKEHPVFKRSGDDLIMRMELTLTEALCGFHKSIKTLDNRVLVISTLPGKFQLSFLIFLLGRTCLEFFLLLNTSYVFKTEIKAEKNKKTFLISRNQCNLTWF